MFPSSTYPPMAQRASLLDACVGPEAGAFAARETIALDDGRADADAFLLAAVGRAMRRVLVRQAPQALAYGPGEGITALREWVAAYLAEQGVRVAPRQVLITSGSRQALDLLGKVLLDPASPLLVQRPTRLGALQAFRPYAPRLVGVRGDEHGPDPQAFADALPGARMAYLQPHVADPGGQAIAPARAEELAARLARSQCWLVEDHGHGELWFDAPPAPGLLARGVAHGVHVGSFSKMLFPGLRLGWVAGHARLVDKLAQARRAAGLQPSSLGQWVLLELLRDGVVQRHLPLLRARWRERRDALLVALQRHMPPGVAWTRPRGGMSVWLTLPESIDAAQLLEPAHRLGLPILPGSAFDVGAGGCASFGDCCACRYVDDAQAAAPVRNALRMGYAGLPTEALEPCARRLGGLLRALAPGVHGAAQGCPGAREHASPVRVQRMRQA